MTQRQPADEMEQPMEMPEHDASATAAGSTATGANLRVIANAFRELFRLRRKLRRWSAEIPPKSQRPNVRGAWFLSMAHLENGIQGGGGNGRDGR